MKKLAMLLSVCSCLFAMGGCAKTPPVAQENGAKETLQVYTSFYPMADFAKKVGGELVTVTNLLPMDQEAHEWEPSPKDIIALGEADVFVYSGAGLEAWVPSVVGTLENDQLLVVEASAGLPLLTEGTETDPHVWLDVALAKAQMDNINKAFAQADPENAKIYQANFDTAAKEFDGLDAKFREELGKQISKQLVVSHEAFAYLCNAYGMEQMGMEGLLAHSEPDAAKMVEIIEFVKSNNVNAIFFEQGASQKVTDMIAKETNVTTAELSTLEGLTPEQEAAGLDYIGVMTQNLNTLVAALGNPQ